MADAVILTRIADRWGIHGDMSVPYRTGEDEECRSGSRKITRNQWTSRCPGILIELMRRLCRSPDSNRHPTADQPLIIGAESDRPRPILMCIK
jgi:hypothetical protein